MQLRSEGPTSSWPNASFVDHDYDIPEPSGNHFLTNAKVQEWQDIIAVLKTVQEQDVLKLKSDIETNNTVSKCWQKMNAYRNNAICLRCSGNSNTFYDLTLNRYKIDRAMCSDLLDTCHEIWSYMANATWAGDMLQRFKKYQGRGHDTRVSTTSLSKGKLHLLWECQTNVTVCKEDNLKLDEACSLFTLAQINQDIEGSSILFESATSVLNNIREGVTINYNLPDEGNHDKNMGGNARECERICASDG
jgi:hypothetical protein